MNPFSMLLFLVGAFASIVAAATAPTFCKCTCFTNSTIIEIKSKSSSVGSSHLKEPAEDSSPSSSSSASTIAATSSSSSTDTLVPTTLPGESIFDGAFEDEEPDAPFSLESRVSKRKSRSKSGRASLSPSCSQCNRAFCLSQSLPICKGAAEKDVVTMCFQRDSNKDMIIVWGFILGTGGLLGWAALRKVMEIQERRGRLAAGGFGGAVDGGLNISRGGLGSTGNDAGRGRYTGVAGHSREGSSVLG